MGIETMGRLFVIGNIVAALAWLMLVFAPLARSSAPRLRDIAGFVVPALFAVAYTALIVTRFASSPGGFGSIAQVRTLFADDGLLLAGWYHYLAFDLFVGGWIAREAVQQNLRHWLVLPCFALTFLFGPAGLLLFIVIRAACSRPRADGAQS